MRCPIETRESAELLLAYCGRTLDAETAAVFERHMESCAACREFARGQRAVWEALDEWNTAPVSPDFDRRLYQRIEREVSWWDLLIRPFRPLLVRQGLPIAAAVGVMIMAGVMLDRPTVTPPSPQQDNAQVQMESLRPDQVEHALDDMDMLRDFSRLMRPDAPDSKKM